MDNDNDVCKFYIKRHNIIIDVIVERYGSAVAIDIMDEVNERLEKKEASEE